LNPAQHHSELCGGETVTTANATQKAKSASEIRVNEKKWSKTLMDAGWTAVPSIILERQKALGLDSLDVNILLHLATYWWTHDNKPHPSKKTIAEAIGVKPRTVQRHIAELEAAGLIKREERRIVGKGSRTNLYHFDGLIKAALPFAKEKLEEIADREKARKQTIARKGKTKLQLIK
jgi:predicted transcriptional regulator